MSIDDRCFSVIKMETGERTVLTSSQYLVYAYLLITSQWNGRKKEAHYHLYKNSMPSIASICRDLGIVRNTWKNSIRALCKQNIIEETTNYYYIKWDANCFSCLPVPTLRRLVDYGKLIKHGGLIVEVLGSLSRYKKYMDGKGKPADTSLSSLCRLFYGKQYHKENILVMDIFMGVYEMLGLIQYHKEKRHKFDYEYEAIVIDQINSSIDKTILDKDVEASYEDLVAAIKRNREARESNLNTVDKVDNRQFQTIIQGNDICRINLNTGEVEKPYTKEEQREPNFVKLYFDHLEDCFNVSKSLSPILIKMLEFATYADQDEEEGRYDSIFK